METTFDVSQLSLIIPAFAVSIFAVLVFVFGFKKPNPLPEFDKNINLTESVTKRKKEKHAATNGDVKKSQPKKVAEPKKKAVVAEKTTKKVSAVVVEEPKTPKTSNKPNFAEMKAQKKQELKEYKESQSDDGWTVVKPKKGAKAEEINVAALVEAAKANLANNADAGKNNKKGGKKEKSNEKEIKNRVNNELKKEENIKAVIEEIHAEATQPTQNKTKKKARRE